MTAKETASTLDNRQQTYQNTSAKLSKRHTIHTYKRNPHQAIVEVCVYIHRIIRILVLAILTLNIIRKCQTFPSTQRFVVTCYCGLIDENATALLIGGHISKDNAHWLSHRAFKAIRHRKFRAYPRIHIANRYFLMSFECCDILPFDFWIFPGFTVVNRRGLLKDGVR